VPSSFTETETIDGKAYQFQLLSLDDALQVESKVAALVAGMMGKGERDHTLLGSIGRTVCKGLTVDDFEVKDIDDEFRGAVLLFNKVVIAGVKVNFPDFFSILAGSEDSPIAEALRESGLVSAI
jgi:hypothetical protein